MYSTQQMCSVVCVLIFMVLIILKTRGTYFLKFRGQISSDSLRKKTRENLNRTETFDVSTSIFKKTPHY